jgi:hypothetical protein
MYPEGGNYRYNDNESFNVSAYTAKDTARMSQQSDSPFPAHLSKCDSPPQKSPMSSYRPIETNESCAILTQRLLQAGCIIPWSFLRLITSSNHIASIMDVMLISIGYIILSSYHHPSLASLWPWPKESLYSVRFEASTPIPYDTLARSSQRRNPSPHKNCVFLCQ